MAKIEAMPAPEIVRAFKGTLDFYHWRGLFIVRSWPRSPQLPRAPGVQATAQAFKDIIQAQGQWATEYHDAAIEQSRGTGYTWRDELVSSLYGNLVTYPEEPPPPTTGDLMALIRFYANESLNTFTVQSVTYVQINALTFLWPVLPFTPTHYRITCHASRNTGAQTLSVQLADITNGNAPIGDGAADISGIGNGAIYDSGTRDISTIPADSTHEIGALCKGTDAFVNIRLNWFDLEIWTDP